MYDGWMDGLLERAIWIKNKISIGVVSWLLRKFRVLVTTQHNNVTITINNLTGLEKKRSLSVTSQSVTATVICPWITRYPTPFEFQNSEICNCEFLFHQSPSFPSSHLVNLCTLNIEFPSVLISSAFVAIDTGFHIK
ncbi:hypothetical protein WAI453_012024 [Rhynchosporium graminicola]